MNISERYIQKTSKHPEYGTEYNDDYIEFEIEMKFIDENNVEWTVIDVKNNKVLLLSENNEYQVFTQNELNNEIDMGYMKIVYDERFYSEDDYKRASAGNSINEVKEEITPLDKLLKLHKKYPNMKITDIANKIADGNIKEYISIMKQYYEKFEN